MNYLNFFGTKKMEGKVGHHFLNLHEFWVPCSGLPGCLQWEGGKGVVRVMWSYERHVSDLVEKASMLKAERRFKCLPYQGIK